MEEVLNGEMEDTLEALVVRATELLAQLSIMPSDSPSDGISPRKLAQTIVRTLDLPEIAGLRSRLVAEHTVYGSQVRDDGEIIVSGIADAVAYDAEGRIEVIVDWKSDITIDVSTLNSYRGQLDTYRQFTGATRALLVLVTTGRVIAL